MKEAAIAGEYSNESASTVSAANLQKAIDYVRESVERPLVLQSAQPLPVPPRIAAMLGDVPPPVFIVYRCDCATCIELDCSCVCHLEEIE